MHSAGVVLLRRSCLLLGFAIGLGTLVAQATDWPEFRGPNGQGHVTDRGFPVTWSETENITWKMPVAGLGWSSPVVVGEQIWLTTAVETKIEPPAPSVTKEEKVAPPADAKKAEEKKPVAEKPRFNVSLRAICLDRKSGKTLHDVEVFQKENVASIHKKNSHASPTAIVADGHVYVHFGAHGTACLTTDGKIVWSTNELKYEHRHGPAGSPVLYQDLLILSCDGTDVQFVVALDKQTGKVRWKSSRTGRMAYSTPLITKVDGRDQLISTGGDAVIAYEPLTGKEIWRVAYKGYSLVPRPVVGHGLAFICSGYDRASLYAVKLGGSGDITESHVAWKLEDAVPLNPSPLLVGNELYIFSDKGIATCLNAEDGKEVWRERMGGNYSASPTLADGHIYITDEEGKTFVLAAKKEYEKLAENVLEGRTLASPAFCDGVIFFRTDSHLYRIEKKK